MLKKRAAKSVMETDRCIDLPQMCACQVLRYANRDAVLSQQRL
jgi:hypothetical protein